MKLFKAQLSQMWFLSCIQMICGRGLSF